MIAFLRRYTHWLHTRWPAGAVETLPETDAEGRTNIPGLFVSGDLTGIPLLKFALDSGARIARRVAGELGTSPRNSATDLVIVGAGVSGMAAALEAQRLGLRIRVLEAVEPLFTLQNFPRQKPIYTYPLDMKPEGPLQVSATVKESLVEELRAQIAQAGIHIETAHVTRVVRRGEAFDLELEEGAPIQARRVLIAIGKSGAYRTLGAPGESLPKVYNRLHDPKDFRDQRVLVVGGGDSALETSIALVHAGAHVTLSYRNTSFSRPKPENETMVRELAAGSLDLCLGSEVEEIRDQEVLLRTKDGTRVLPNDVVFVMIGRLPPLGFFRRSGVRIRGERGPVTWISLALVLALATWLYHWKTSFGIPVNRWWQEHHWFPFNIQSSADPAAFLGTLSISLQSPSFYYSLAYSAAVTYFGWRRIRRRRTPYVTWQTLTLIAIQVLPLFLLPYLLLPWAGHNGYFDSGVGRSFADAFFPLTEWDPHGREYWRAVGFILAWPLMFWNVFTSQPLGAWLWVSVIQTFILIPLLVYFWGKGAYCSWVCSCGALAETVGDTMRHKMPHGPGWNRLNMLGQGILLVAGILLLLRIVSWLAPAESMLRTVTESAYMAVFLGKTPSYGDLPFPFTFLNYNWIVDITLAGILGVGLYAHLSGRTWCRFACPLAALMHIYARKSRFRILADKKKCISCNVCTSVCHQGIDVMNFANKGLPMEDPECVRCSACVEACPTGVLEFGQVDASGRVSGVDRLAASPVLMREGGNRP
ncbi:MAG TPA: NAD(P)-binding domain-containing protein [Candidatus Eisenbacteria bacterium]|nr:NAD(P)-binding domain-containing protein [Candidatus Eisenbacteria bacterium]